jgi:hypothetical protein
MGDDAREGESARPACDDRVDVDVEDGARSPAADVLRVGREETVEQRRLHRMHRCVREGWHR